MPSLVNDFLHSELTCLPEILRRYIGKYYSNALCNGCTWLLMFWYIIHLLFDNVINEFFKKMRIKEFNRIRLKRSVWYLGFYGTAFLYTGATLFQHQVDVLGLKKNYFPSYPEMTTNIATDFLILISFYMHSAIWDMAEYNSKPAFCSYASLSSFLLFTYYHRIVEISFTLTAFISITQVSIESAKLMYVVTTHDTSYLQLMVKIFFALSICSFILSYLIGVPLLFLIPLIRNTMFHPRPFHILLMTSLAAWFICEINHSPLCRLIKHWLFHSKEEIMDTTCCDNLIECSLFPLRTDVSFNLRIIRREIKERQDMLMSKRRTNKKSVLMQTLKCMVTLKRKIKKRRASKSPSSEDDGSNENSTRNVSSVSESDDDNKSDLQITESEINLVSSASFEEKSPFYNAENFDLGNESKYPPDDALPDRDLSLEDTERTKVHED